MSSGARGEGDREHNPESRRRRVEGQDPWDLWDLLEGWCPVLAML